MLNKKIWFLIFLFLLAVIAVFAVVRLRAPKTPAEVVMEIRPARGTIETVISTTGTVLPKTRLEIKPPVNGRVEQVLVKEGEKVKPGQNLAWMSSTERAALLDAARGKGEKTLKYWEDVYKPIPLISPIDGDVIVSKAQPGQAVITSDAVVVLSDHLIVRAQVDETDIGKIRQDQPSVITLDAYPDTKIKGAVEHIYHESKTVNNVTMYEVDVIPDEVPPFFRSGMNATVDFKEKGKEGALLIPQEAVAIQKDGAWVFVKQAGGKEPVKRAVELGISDDKQVEVISGVSEQDTVLMKTKKYSLPKADTTGTNPFMPGRRR